MHRGCLYTYINNRENDDRYKDGKKRCPVCPAKSVSDNSLKLCNTKIYLNSGESSSRRRGPSSRRGGRTRTNKTRKFRKTKKTKSTKK
jgi:hypothetical protein